MAVPHTKSAKMGSFKIGRRLLMAKNWAVGLRSNLLQSVETHRTGANLSGVQRTIGRLRNNLKSVSERVNFREIDPKYLKFSQFLVS